MERAFLQVRREGGDPTVRAADLEQMLALLLSDDESPWGGLGSRPE